MKSNEKFIDRVNSLPADFVMLIALGPTVLTGYFLHTNTATSNLTQILAGVVGAVNVTLIYWFLKRLDAKTSAKKSQRQAIDTSLRVYWKLFAFNSLFGRVIGWIFTNLNEHDYVKLNHSRYGTQVFSFLLAVVACWYNEYREKQQN